MSDDDRRRDLDTKRHEYARAGIREYWIVDADAKAITVLRLEDGRYSVHGRFESPNRATSVLLPDFEVDVGRVFEAAKRD